jgi:hypothetical protein
MHPLNSSSASGVLSLQWRRVVVGSSVRYCPSLNGFSSRWAKILELMGRVASSSPFHSSLSAAREAEGRDAVGKMVVHLQIDVWPLVGTLGIFAMGRVTVLDHDPWAI